MIDASPSTKDTFVYLTVGSVFVIMGFALLESSPVMWLFIGLGFMALISFAVQSGQTRITYTFDSSSQNLYLSQGETIPFSKIENVRVHEDTWRGSYGESHSNHSVVIVAGLYGTYSLPANSLAEAEITVTEILEHLFN